MTPRTKGMAPTKRADWVKPGDTCECGPGSRGVVISVRTDTALPQARVRWASGSTGTHTISTLRRVEGQS